MKGIILAILVFYPFLGGLLAYAVGRRNELYRDYLADFVTASELVLMAVLFIFFGDKAGEGAVMNCRVAEICGFGLNFTMDGFRLVYGTIAALMWMMTTILSREYFRHHENRNRFYLFLLLTLGATMGVFLSADLYTTFIFFEIMSFTSYVWVAQEENEPSLRAAATYLAVAVIGGLVMLMGIFLVYHALGTVKMSELLEAAEQYQDKKLLYIAGTCMLFGFGAKAGAFPLHIWLPKAHPVAPAPASALLSGILTKTGIFGVLVVSSEIFLHDAAWGTLLLSIGVLTMFGGAVLAVFSVDLKRTLACSSMSQIGFILVGAGMQGLLGEENALAVHGTMLHMMNHSMIKLVLFMAAGVIYMNTHALDLNKIRGFGRKKPLLKGIFLIGALAIGGIPLFGGYISKTLLHESIVEFGGGFLMHAVEWIFLFSGGLTVAYMTKLFVAVFVEENESREVQRKYDGMKSYMSRESTFALAGSALLLLIWGLFPHGLMDRAAELGQGFMHLEEFGHVVSYFSLKNLSGACISIAIGAVVYLFFIRRILMREEKKGLRSYVDLWPAWLDLENLLYRPVLLELLPVLCEAVCRVFDRFVDTLVKYLIPVCGVVCRIFDSLPDLLVVGLRKSVYRDSPLPHELSEGNIFTLACGRVLNFWQRLANRTWQRKNPVRKDYVHILAVKHDELKENNMIIGRSLSFALLLVCIGLCLTLIYILWL
ncbi:MAG: complex I subunit 5 family protein [Lachnospiraceae bacterium]|nr:complex I subunit 5 family protein [Lachnospiraceae bacterium]